MRNEFGEVPVPRTMRQSDHRVVLNCEIVIWTSEDCPDGSVLEGLEIQHHIDGYEEITGACRPDILPVGRRFVFVMCGDCYSGLLERAREVAAARGVSLEAALRSIAAAVYRGAKADSWRFSHSAQCWERVKPGQKVYRTPPTGDKGRRLSA